MGYSRKIIGKNRNLRKRSRKVGQVRRRNMSGGGQEVLKTQQEAISLGKFGKFIYVCCNLYDDNVIKFIKQEMKYPHAKIWLNVNSYNVVGKGGKPFSTIEQPIKDYLGMLCDTNINDIPDARQYNIYCLNSSPAFNNKLVSDWYKENGYDKVVINPFGLKKIQKILKAFKYENDENYIDLDSALFTQKNDGEFDDLKNLYNNALEKLRLLSKISADEAIDEWFNYCKEISLVNLIESNKDKIIEKTRDKRLFTQAQKVVDSIVRGPILPHDHLGLLVASYIHTNNYENETQWNNIHDPVDIQPATPVAITKKLDRTNFSGFDSYLYRLLNNKSLNSSSSMTLPHIIYHDCEEDDIAAMQYIGIHKKEPFTCIVQSSAENETEMQKLLPTMVSDNAKIEVKVFSLSRDAPVGYDKNGFENFTINEPGNSHVSENKTLIALQKCANSLNSFALLDNPAAAATGGRKKYRKSRQTKRRRSTKRRKHTKKRRQTKKRRAGKLS